MAQKACSRLAAAIPWLLANRNVISASGRALSNTFGTYSRCASYIYATHKVYVLRSFSSSPLPETDVSYEQLKKLLATRTSVVIDVREPWELREYGNIPGSINVPLGQVNIALQLNPEEFKEKYGGDMPQPSDHIVFSCLAGIRSQKALDQAVSLGYKDVQHYAGGWQDWAKCEQES
ncbi:thiosulfate sulfurtransferase/rhodanese-like domain-containing protein 3 [Salmo salar]|uniref:Heat shock protein 67B2 n=1 Tax=Salmo salar TaxID=8030 RepID=B5XB73_SALSA|nr:thiosulfate sulfurtransferase/rhodanese-like domain-containing protein 3 [Salmo salar]ACI68093.1 Heat shock protein 67B2 [Salmo salar]ACI69293.1 Heat shock protein 67B2 [Salmo salar]|eukprot:NP_001134583.1 Heat shock protein 67B2 [Salmo salar]